jgi:ComF family protein
VRNQWTKLEQILFPAHCVLCGDKGSGSQDLCPSCLASLPQNRHNCVRCGTPLSINASEALCGQCLQRPPPFERVLSPFLYEAPTDHLIQQLKFSGRLEMARLLGNMMASWLGPRLDSLPDEIIPVPLHHKRLRERGFNQALELARPIARRLQLPLNTHACQRIRFTVPQTGLPAAERARNVKNAFEVTGTIGRRIALVDDVMTTGQTLHAVTHAVRKAGAEEVEVWVCARA